MASMASRASGDHNVYIRPLSQDQNYIFLSESEAKKTVNERICINCGGGVFNSDMNVTSKTRHLMCSWCGRETVIHI